MNPAKGFRLTAFILLLLVCYLTFFRGLGDYGLWDPDEGRSGVIAKEIVNSGNWLTLTRNGEPYYDKPVLYFWLVALGIKILGLSELAVRLPSALAATLTVGIVFLWGLASGGWKRGLWGGLVLATSMEFVALGRFGNTDMVFTFFFTAALLSFLWWKERGTRQIWPFYLFLALASLTKGPVGVVLPFLILGITLGLRKKMALLREMHLLQGMGLVLLFSGSWYLVAALYDPEYIKTFLWDHNVLRFLTSRRGISHPEPFYYLFVVFLGGFLPWIFFLPVVLGDFRKSRGDEAGEKRLFLLVWAVTVLLFFSFARNKLGTYILPAFPPLALLTGDVIKGFVAGEASEPWRDRWIIFGSFLWLFSLVAIPPLGEMIFRSRYPQYFPLNLPIFLAALFFLLATVAWALRKQRWTPWIVSFSSLWLVLWFYGSEAPEISELRGTRTLTRILNGNGSHAYRVVALRAESFSFYLPNHVQVVSLPDIIESMLEESIPTVALIKEKHLREMARLPREKLFLWKSIPSAGALVANFPLSPSQNSEKAVNR